MKSLWHKVIGLLRNDGVRVILAAGCLFALVVVGMRSIENAARRRAEAMAKAEIADMNSAISAAQQPFDTLSRLFAQWEVAKTATPHNLVQIKNVMREADARLTELQAMKCRTGAGERVRRILVRELHNVRALGMIVRNCQKIQIAHKVVGGATPCYSFAGPQIFEHINRDRKALDKLLNGKPPLDPPNPPPQEKFAHNSTSQYNVVVVLIDTLRADRITPEFMPYLHSLAQKGTWYTNARTAAPVTHVSVSSMFTASYPYTHGLIKDDALWHNELSWIPKFAQEPNPYQTVAFCANNLIAPETGFGNGFQEFIPRHWADADVVNEAVFSWLETAESTADNLFMYIHTVDPHSAYLPPDMIDAILASQDPYWNFTISPNPYRQYWIDKGLKVPNSIQKNVLPLMEQNYDYSVIYADKQLEVLVRHLEEKGLMDKTILVVMGDHGEAFLEHGEVKHTRNVYDEMVHVPLIFSGGPFDTGRIIDTPVSLVDVMPTLYKAARGDVSAHVVCEGFCGQGMNLSHIKPGKRGDVFSLTTMGFYVPGADDHQTMHALFRDGYKLIQFQEQDLFELYNLKKDPFEKHDLFDEHDARSRDMKKRLLNWVADTKSDGKMVAAMATKKQQANQKRMQQGGKKKQQQTPTPAMDNEMQRRLKELGYVK